MFCEAFCFFPDDGRWHKCSRGPSSFTFPTSPLGSCHRELSVRRAYCPLYPQKADIRQRIEHVCFVP
jgi:hypothetical protein